MTEQELTGLVRTMLTQSHEPDPHVIAQQLLPQLSPAYADALILAGLTGLVRRVIQLERCGGMSGQRPAGPSKWQIAQRVCVAGAWKLLEECDLADLRELAQDYRRRAAEMVARAEEMEQLAAQLDASGCLTVGDLWNNAPEALAA